MQSQKRIPLNLSIFLQAAATALLVFLSVAATTQAQTIRIAGIGANSGNTEADVVCSSGDLDCTVTRIDATTYNAMSVASLRANFDVLLFTWNSPGAVDADWTTRVLPYLNLGGGVIFEDGSSPNIADLAPGIIGNGLGGGTHNVIAVVPGLTDGVTNSFVNNHLQFTAWDPAFAPFLELASSPGTVTGLFGDVGGCRMVVTGPDQDFHATRGAGDPAGNQYRLLVNEIRWVSECKGISKTIVSGPDRDPLLDPLLPQPDSITFQTQNTTCGSQATFNWDLNGIPLGSTPSDPTFSCTCSAPIDSFAVTDAGLIASAWNVGGPNDLRFVKSGGDNATAWTRAVLDFGGVTDTICVFDSGGGNCDVTDLCNAGFTFANVDVTTPADPFGPDGAFDLTLEVGTFGPSAYDFKITYNNPDGLPVLIEDTVPAEWGVMLLDDDSGRATAQGANKKKNNKSATKIKWTPDPAGGMITVWADSRMRPNGKFAPTSCGTLYLNDGAEVFEIDPATGEPFVDGFGKRLPPIFESNNLCLAAVKDVNGDGLITRDGTGDEDGDGLTDLEEACELGTDPCDPDTDGDGALDGADADPLDPSVQ